ncbi:component of the polarisome [Malassezia equina]|uniref:Component of the polarisome n=1 Tax=Malassezia equina TaxID=1381935 RepID=A0AAF0J1Q6_9BASI|nr:component of the polarisome [Malassezia equina]
MAPQGQRMGSKFLHQITGLGGSHNQDTSTRSSSSASSPMKSQLASLFQKKEPARVTSPIESPPATLPSGYGQGDSVGRFSNDTSGGRRFFGADTSGASRPSMDANGVQAGRFPQAGGFGQQLNNLGSGAMQQTGQLGMGATRITQQGMNQVGQFGRDGMHYTGQGLDHFGQTGQSMLNQPGQFGQNTLGQVGQVGQNTMDQTGQFGQGTLTQAGQFGQNTLGQTGQFGQNTVGQVGAFGQSTDDQVGQAGQSTAGLAGNGLGQATQLGQSTVHQTDQLGQDTLGQAGLLGQDTFGQARSLGPDAPSVPYGQVTHVAGAPASLATGNNAAWSGTDPTSAAPVDASQDTSSSPVRSQAPSTAWMSSAPPKREDPTDASQLARMYYVELLQFFRTQPARHSLLTASRASAREKLTRLNKQQFSELSTDVHDELQRRQDVQQLMPYLPGRDDFHPKRNQARQKLSTLPKSRFRDLASDVFFELERRFPELPMELRSEPLEYLMGGREAQENSAPPLPANNGSALSPVSEQPSVEPVALADEAPEPQRLSNATLAQRQLAEVMADAQQLTSSQVYVPPRSTAVEDDVGASGTRDGTEPPASTTVAQDAAPVAPPIPTETMASAPVVAEAVPEPATWKEPPAPVAPAVSSAELQAYEQQVSELQQRVRTLETQEATLRDEGDQNQRQLEELQSRNAALVSRVAQLEQELDGHVQQSRDLQAQSEQHRSALDDKHAELLQYRADLDDLRRQYDDLHLQHASRAPDAEAEAQWKREIDEMQRSTAEHQRMVQELRDEVASLLDELRRLSARNDAMTADKESDVAIIRDLHQQMSSYKRRFEQAKAELRMMQTTAQLWAQPQAEEWKHLSDRGAMADTNVQAFQSSIDELLAAARSSTPSNVLIAMKTVVLSTTLLTDDVAKFESQPENMETLTAQQRDDVNSLKLSMSEALSNLMTACRNHASSQGLSPVSLVDAAATHVAMAVVELIKLLKLRHVPKPVEDDTSLDSPSDTTAPSGLKPLHMRGAASPPNALPRSMPRAAVSSPSLRSLSYSHSNLESRMLAMDKQGLSGSPSHNAAASSNGAAPSLPPTQPTSATRELPSIPATSPVTPSTREPTSESTPASLLTLPSMSAATPWSVQTASMQTMPEDQGPSTFAYGTAVSAPGEELTSREEDADNWAELRNYIEVQTEAIVHSIQSLLSALREGAQGVQLNENLTQITTIVSSIVVISRDHLPQVSARHPSMATEAERIFADLTENCDRLSDMQSNETFDRSAKSVMASASYGVAKGLKSLNELLNAADETS